MITFSFRPAPRLKDADLNEGKLRQAYMDTIKQMRVMFHKCRLVHADLSEYNMLYDILLIHPCRYYKKLVYFIDVSQSVEHDHPHALAFLMKDCTNVTDFFTKKGLTVLKASELFDFVTDLTITEDTIDAYLEKVTQSGFVTTCRCKKRLRTGI